MSARRALITGITGQDGSYLAEQLLEAGDHVVGVARPPLDRPMPNLAAIRGEIELVTGDLGDPGSLEAAIRAAAPDDVFHLAAPTFVPDSWEDPAGTLAQIAVATAAVLRAAGSAGARVLVASSPEIFGDPAETPQTERTPRRPASPYGVAKLAAHELARVLGESGAVETCVAITYNHESPRRPERFVTRRITSGVAAIRAGRADELVLGDLDARRDWSHAADVVRGMRLALGAGRGGDYVLAGGTARTVRAFAEAAFAAAGLEAAPYLRVDPALVRPARRGVLEGDASRAREELGWEPRVSFEALVEEMVAADLARVSR